MEQQQTFYQKVEVFFFKLGVGVGLTTTVVVGFFGLAAALDDGGGTDATDGTFIQQED